MREKVIEQEMDPMNIIKRKIQNSLNSQEIIPNQFSSFSSLSSSSSSQFTLPATLIPNLNTPTPQMQQQQQLHQQQQSQSHAYQQLQISPVSKNHPSNQSQFDSPISQYDYPPPDQQHSSTSQDDYEDYNNSFSNDQGQVYAQINGKIHPVQGIIRTKQGVIKMTPQQMMSYIQGKEMLITYKTTGSSMGNDSYYSDDGYNEYQTNNYRSGSSFQQSATIVEDKDKKDKQNMKKKENIDKDSKKEKIE